MSRWSRYLPTSDEMLPRVVAYRMQLDRLTHREFVWLPYRSDVVEAVVHLSIWHLDHRFGGVQNISYAPVNIRLPACERRSRDRQVVDDPGPSADFLRLWFLDGKRYLAVEYAFHQLPPDEMHIEAT
ncbi:hypothetical protein PIB30_093427 [Stylosanthes scabra]|uniref:Uncharacterized protein n=1 Tax=Stylosanthes scabra TaxID=79078 RepID=A0ABU6TXI6_9FABA|nr:hypothetical protein [Stylosanthes scabra]